MSDHKVHIIGGGLAGCEAAWQLAKRGVKVRLSEMRGGGDTTPAHQGEGFGSRLIRFAEADVKKETIGPRFWCNARLAAVPFYERNGWEIPSDRFEVPIFGPHHKMIRF